MKKQQFKRLLSLALAIVMCLGLALPALAAEAAEPTGGSNVTVEKVDNSRVTADLGETDRKVTPEEETPLYADTDSVRVSIVLEGKSALQVANRSGIGSTDLASSGTVTGYREQLKQDQLDLADRISTQILGGAELDVVWNLTLVANIISANVPYGEIEAIAALPGVKDVVLETCYEPAVVSVGGDDPNMATSASQIGSTTAYLEGYYGAGSRIAIIDTGTDVDHISFNNDAFLYALKQNAQAADMTYEAYVASLDLLDEDEIAELLPQLHAYERMGSLTAADLFVSEKLAFGFNYVDVEDYPALAVDLSHYSSEHGSHVAGIATANRYIETSDGVFEAALDTVMTQGVAPDAQLITMKVFGKGGGAYESDYMVAIEDAIVLGCDAINLSLGSSAPGMTENSTYADILDELTDSDTVVVISAGNNGSYVDGSTNGVPYLFYDDVSFHTGGSPGTYTNSLGVASVDNAGYTQLCFKVNGENVLYTESATYGNLPITTLAGEQEYVFINGIGTAEEFAAVDVTGKIALCYRGTTSFYEKANAAVAAGAIGVIIVNNTTGTIGLNLTGYTYTAPVVSITQASGELFKTNPVEADGEVQYWTGTMTINENPSVALYDSEYYTMSSFSSWGVPGDLSMKPEITAPGGSIYSVYGTVASEGTGGTDQYVLMSGTSMAAPQVTGMMALLMQYIRENDLSVNGLTDRALAQSLLMSTAVPLFEETGDQNWYYSILKQGAGLANIGAAVKANSYILMGASANDSYADGKVKVELGDDPDKIGEYSFTFSINNLTDTVQNYTLDADFFTQDAFAASGFYFMDTWTTPLTANVSYTVGGVPMVADSDLLDMDFDGDGSVTLSDGQALLDYVSGKREDLSAEDLADLDEDGDIDSYDAYLFFQRMGQGVVSVPANGSVNVTVNFALDPEDPYLSFYPNGAYIEGYVYARNLATEEGVEGETHSIPVLGYYGNWTDASMFDKGSYWDYASGAETRPGYLYGLLYGQTNFVSLKRADSSDEYYFGGNPYISDDVYLPERNALNNENGDQLAKYYFSSIRNAGNSKLEIKDANTGEIYLTGELGKITSAYYYETSSSATWKQARQTLNMSWAGTDANKEKLPNNTVVDVSLILAPELYRDSRGNYDWDALGTGAALTTRVTIDNTAPELVGDTPVVIEDDTLSVSVRDNQYVAAVALFDAYGEYCYCAVGSDPEATANTTGTFELSLDGVDGASFLLQVYDYAGNTTTYQITRQIGTVTDTVSGVSVTPTSVVLQKGNTATLSAVVAPVNASDRSYTWSSSNASVATVSNAGLVTAVGVGEAVITATSTLDPTKFASCAVEVIDINVDLDAIVWDENGSIWISRFNTTNLPNYTKLSGDLVNDDYFVSTAVDSDGVLYSSTLNTSSGAGSIYKFNVYQVDGDTTYTPVKLADCEVGISIFSADLAYAPSLDLLVGLYGPYILLISPDSGSIVGLIQWCSNNLVSVAYAGSVLNTYYNTYIDIYYFMDAEGNLYQNAFISLNGGISYFYDEEDGLMGDTGLGTDLFYFQSMFVKGNYLFISNFVDANNYVAIYAMDTTTGEIYKLGQFEDSVWPVAGLYDGSTVTARTGVSSSSVGSLAEMTAVGSALSAEECAVESLFGGNGSNAAAGGLNSVASASTGASLDKSSQQITEDEDVVKLSVTAKNAQGTDVKSTNGVVTVTYDPDCLTLKEVKVNADYKSVVDDAENGTVTIAYVSLEGIKAGNAIAELTFDVVEGQDGELSILHSETGATHPEYTETVSVAFEHSFGDWYVLKAATCTEVGTMCRDCLLCGLSQYEDIPATGHEMGQWYVYRPTSTLMAGEKRRECQHEGCEYYETQRIPILSSSGSGAFIPTPDPVKPSEPTEPDMPFADVEENDPYYESVRYVYEKGLMIGVSATSFAPASTLDRATVVTVLYRLENSPEVTFAGVFSDVADGEWYSNAVEWAAANGLVVGYPDGTFGPKIAVTNEQLATILHRYAVMKGYDVSSSADLTRYADGAKVSDYATAAVAWALAMDLSATQDGMVCARQDSARGQVAYALHHFMVNVMGE